MGSNMMKSLRYLDLLTDIKDIIEIKFRGDNPSKLLNVVLPLMQRIIELDSPKLAERELKWDTTDGSFQGRWAAYKSYDKWTKMWVDANVWGKQDLQTKYGACTIKLKGYLITDFSYANSIQQGFWWTYNYMFYTRVRRKLFDQSKDYYYKIGEEIKANLNILQKDVTSGIRT